MFQPLQMETLQEEEEIHLRRELWNKYLSGPKSVVQMCEEGGGPARYPWFIKLKLPPTLISEGCPRWKLVPAKE